MGAPLRPSASTVSSPSKPSHHYLHYILLRLVVPCFLISLLPRLLFSSGVLIRMRSFLFGEFLTLERKLPLPFSLQTPVYSGQSLADGEVPVQWWLTPTSDAVSRDHLCSAFSLKPWICFVSVAPLIFPRERLLIMLLISTQGPIIGYIFGGCASKWFLLLFLWVSSNRLL